MSRVGILSMQRIKNYGSFLQAYALKSIIEELGHSVEFVDYHVGDPLVESKKDKSKFLKGMDVFKGEEPIIQKLKYIYHKSTFEKKFFNILKIENQKNYNPKLDTLVIGSDEVFNCIQSNPNVGYSLELFGKNNNANKVITYAASFGNTTIDKIEKYNKSEELASLLKKIDNISVRDKNSGDVIRKLTNRDVSYNLDPVLIYDYMNKNIVPEMCIKEKYILVYAYSGRIKRQESDYIKKIAKQRNLKVYSIGGAQKCADKFIDCSPFEVFSYFKNAEFIITDTFHGSIFSIVTHRPFITLVRKSIGENYGNEEKLTDLLERLKLDNRIVYNYEDIESKLEESIDYKEIESLLSNERKKSIEYLEEKI